MEEEGEDYRLDKMLTLWYVIKFRRTSKSPWRKAFGDSLFLYWQQNMENLAELSIAKDISHADRQRLGQMLIAWTARPEKRGAVLPSCRILTPYMLPCSRDGDLYTQNLFELKRKS
ncbi:hypothetical protein SADUNF_Sadunf15G0112100 [Salix dunnii]|uniref:Uncharacterized protein n=1 Tax=Salix dunnii TaxID=1413687 RepID=A0A835JF47_9ROSI|nr:hypothetical protein SADUNF_Sadunf15G0112100 [Salix dunnii]